MKVENMTSAQGNKVANQFVITDKGKHVTTEVFQSYKSVIVKRQSLVKPDLSVAESIELDSYYWDYSVTTGKYRNQFLGETKQETQKKIDSGEYILTNLN